MRYPRMDVEALIQQLTLEEKVQLTAGKSDQSTMRSIAAY
jgi:hypothetical protein